MIRRIKDVERGRLGRGVVGGLALMLAAAACGEAPTEAPIETTASGSAPISAQPAAAAARPTGTVTLITGDHVRVTLQNNQLFPSVIPGPDRNKVAFAINRVGDQIRVVPSDAQALISAGRLDPELFNVTRLLAEGLGDERRDDLPLIITHHADLPTLHNRLATTAGITVDRTLPVLHTLAVRQRKANAGAVLATLNATASTGSKIWLDHRRKVTLDKSVPQIGAPAAYARGFTGAGVSVAVLDSGIDATHPDFAGKIIAAQDFVGDGNGTNDVFGHGTHVASIVAGSGAASGGRFHGVAIDSTLINGRVCDAFGNCSDSALLAGIEWAVTTQHAKIINMSIGGPDTPDVDPVEDAINTMSAQFGTLFVVAAGNDGGDNTIESPGSADAALSVGAVDINNQLAFFSSRGPRTGDHAIKPDITGPGVGITAARAAGSNLGPIVDDVYMTLSGTSMATPHVAGSAAILLQQHPTWTGQQLKEALMNTAQPTDGLTVYQQGAGRVDIDRGTRHAVSTDPGSESFGIVPFPHDQDPPLVRTVTYHNGDASPVTLSLAASLASKSGPAAPGAVTVAPATLTIPAGATATATVTINTQIDDPNEVFGGTLIATGADLRIITPIGVEREGQKFNLTFNTLGTDGAETQALMTIHPIVPFTDPNHFEMITGLAQGPTTLRLPAGVYAVESNDSLSANSTMMLAPRLDLTTHDVSVVFDGRLAKPLDVHIPQKHLDLFTNLVDYEDVEDSSTYSAGTFNPLFTAQVGPGPAPGKSHSYVQMIFSSQPFDSPTDIYNLAHEEQDHLLAGWAKTFKASDFANIDVTVAGREDRDYFKQVEPLCPDGCAGLAQGIGSIGTFEHTEHYFGPRFTWATFLQEDNPDEFDDFVSAQTAIEDFNGKEGQTLTQVWNQAVFGPLFPGPNFDAEFGRNDSLPLRTADGFLHLSPSLYADSAGHEGNSAGADGASTTLTLFENGTQIAQVPDTLFPADLLVSVGTADADFRLSADGTRSDDLFPLSTHVTADWTFHSGPSTSDQFLALPVMRFTPALNRHNRTGATVLPLPISIVRPAHAPTPKIKSASLDVSFDDGATWKPVSIALTGDKALAVIVHPAGTTFVSLHGKVTDVRGNTVDQTIIHAYELKAPNDPAD